MNKRCIGCGSIMQTTNADQIGYTPSLDFSYCARCFQLKNYGTIKDAEPLKEDQIINTINQDNALTFFLCDYLNINNYTLNLYQHIKTPKILVISKADILRKEMTHSKLINYIKETYNIKERIIFLSTKSNYNVDILLNILAKESYSKAYITGLTNAGKSTLINALIHKYNLKKEILTSKYPNTTLNFIKLKISSFSIIDTPGFTYPNISSNPTILKPITYNITKPTTIILNSKYQFYFSKPTSVTLYLNNNAIKRVYHPISGQTLNLNSYQDIVIVGLGYLSLTKPTSVTLSSTEFVEIRESRSKHE